MLRDRAEKESLIQKHLNERSYLHNKERARNKFVNWRRIYVRIRGAEIGA